MEIQTNYPGGNVIVLGVTEKEGKTYVDCNQDRRDTTTWWFYWNFKVTNPPKGEMIFRFHDGKVVCPHGPATSADGVHWTWGEQDCFLSHTSFRYVFDGSERERYFAFTIPYVMSDFERFFEAVKGDGEICRSVLCRSEQNRELPLLTLGHGKRDVFFTARNHCCESTASYALEGAISALLTSHRCLLDTFRFHVVPMVDIDGVENGDQGKNRAPHDHNRDYCEAPIYQAVSAIFDYTDKLDLAAFIDFHSPWSWGGRDDEPHIHLAFYEEASPAIQEEFLDHLVTVSHEHEGIPYHRIVTYYGASSNRPDATSSKNYFAQKKGIDFSFTIETPYSGKLEKGYTADMLRAWGVDIVESLARTYGLIP